MNRFTAMTVRIQKALQSRFWATPAFWGSKRIGCVILALLVVAFFADLLFGDGTRIVSHAGTDIGRQFAAWRHFGFGQVREGNFPLWTPYVYGGMPFFSGFQAALLYPPNWGFVVLPLSLALNWSVALHVWWLGVGMFIWMRDLGMRQVSALFCGAVLMFSAPYFLHIYAGHLSNLCVMAWMPWLMLAVTRWRAHQGVGWILFGALVVAMQIFAGHPQYVYYGAIATSLYAILLLFIKKDRRLRFVLGVIGVYVMACLLAAVQLLPGIEAAGESVRAGGTSMAFAGSYSFPPENLLTTLVPFVFGDMTDTPYWGRWFYWEMSAYFGVIALWLAVVGAIWGGRAFHPRIILIAAAACVVLALGSYTPLFQALYAMVPGYDLFRGSSKFIFFAVMFAVVLSGVGLECLLDRKALRGERWLLVGGVVGVILCAICAVWIARAAEAAGWSVEMWSNLRRWLWETGQVTHVRESEYFSPTFGAAAADNASHGFRLACVLLLTAVAGTCLRRRFRAAIPILLVVGCVEVLLFGIKFRDSFEADDLWPQRQIAFRDQHAGDFRVLDVSQVNAGMLSRLPDLWGDDPGVLRRYAQFMAITQEMRPDQASQHLKFTRTHRLWSLLRGRYLFEPKAQGVIHRRIPTPPLDRFLFIRHVDVLQDRDRLLGRLQSPDFDPRETVLLEQTPAILISTQDEGDINGTWTILRENMDEVVVELTVDRSCILLMTDPYSTGWQVEGLIENPLQDKYELIPADYVLRGIPLAEGPHRLRIFYEPLTYKPAAVISLISWALLLVTTALLVRRRG